MRLGLKSTLNSTKSRQNLVWALFYIGCFLVSALIFYHRFPNNFTYPNFYAEDGRIFSNNLFSHGLIKSLLTTFNGYYIWGYYLLVKTGMVLNQLVYGGGLLTLPQSLALVSYGFLAFAVTLPLLLFRRWLGYGYGLALVLLTGFVPLVGSDYAIIGVIGNLKYIFVYIAFCLLVYRLTLPKNSKVVALVDLILLVCAYTNATVYLLMPVLLVRYLPLLWQNRRGPVEMVRDRSFVSLVILGALLLPQLVVVKLHGIPKLPGYLDSPFDKHRAIEILLWRPYFYSIFYWITDATNAAAIGLMAALVGLLWWFGERKERIVYGFGLYAIFVTTALFVMNRPGVSDFFFGYKAGGPDQFFYTQNLIFDFLLVLLVRASWMRASRPKRWLFGLATFGLLLLPAAQAGSYGRHDFMQKDIGDIWKNAKADCQDSNTDPIILETYPTKEQTYAVWRSQLCTPELNHYQEPIVDVGLTSYQNHYLNLAEPTSSFTQTFRSMQSQLDGVEIFLSTFNRSSSSPYRLKLMDADCKNILREASLPNENLQDNSFAAVTFKPIADSKDKSFCFSIEPKNKLPTPLAVQLSQPGVYLDGNTTVNGQPSDSDVVFQLMYKDRDN